MGYLEVGLGHLNRMFGDPALLREHRDALLALYSPSDGAIDGEPSVVRTTSHMLGQDSPLGSAVQGIDPEQITGVLRRLSPTIIEAARAIVYGNLQRQEPYGMTFAWRPGYDHELTVWESTSADNSPGWITVLIKSRYPLDPHPISG